VETKSTIIVIETQSLIAHAGANTVGSEQCRQKMTLRVAVSAALAKNL
jgi:hypothetical protein